MITASEPLEFIPRGRQAVEQHPGPLVANNKQTTNSAEHILLHRLQNVKLSNEDNTESWTIYEPATKFSDPATENACFYYNFTTHHETELYFKGSTAVCYNGEQTKYFTSAGTCFSCETPIKYGLFCPRSFAATEPSTLVDNNTQETCVCLIDTTSLNVYCADGENYTATLDFPVSNVWCTNFGLVFEKDALTTTIGEAHHICFPRVFSMSHPLEEIRPVLMKPLLGAGPINYFTEAEYKIIFTETRSDLVLLHDNKQGRHFICVLRRATDTEIDLVNQLNVTLTSGLNCTTAHSNVLNNTSGKYTAGGGSGKVSNITFGMASKLSAQNTPTHHHHHPQPANRTTSTTWTTGGSTAHLALLQSTLSSQNAVSTQTLRRIGEEQPESKPIVPEHCFESVWMERAETAGGNRKYVEAAAHGFLHTNFVGQRYICYLLPRICELNLVRMSRTPSGKYTFDDPIAVPAKDAIAMHRLNMIAVLGTCGTLMLYSGHSLIGKVHIGGILSSLATSSNLSNNSSFSGGSALPRRSSLLPSVTVTPDQRFESELHMLSPVHPLQPSVAPNKNGQCSGLRDAVDNRLTINYPNGKLFRFSLPVLSENIMVTKCLIALKNVLETETALSIIIKWYGVRNAPGIQDFTPQREWTLFSGFLLELMGCTGQGEERLSSSSSSSSMLDEPKKRRKDEDLDVTDSDWRYMMSRVTRVYSTRGIDEAGTTTTTSTLDANAILYHHIPIVIYTFHLLYEDIKLDATMQGFLEPTAELLYRLALLMKLDHYALHYFTDFPRLIHVEPAHTIPDQTLEAFRHRAFLIKTIPSIFNFIYTELVGEGVPDSGTSPSTRYPIIRNVNYRSFQMLKVLKTIHRNECCFEDFIELENVAETTADWRQFFKRYNGARGGRNEDILNCLIDLGVTRDYLESLPIALYTIISNCLDEIRVDAPIGMCADAYRLLLRPELVVHASVVPRHPLDDVQSTVQKEHSLSPRVPTIPDVIPKSETSVSDEDGMEHMDTKLLRLRFPTDLRINDVRTFLNSSAPVLVDMVQAPNVTDHEFIEEQEKFLYAVSIRTMALPVGRGMFTLRTSTPTITESLPIPKLCLSGKDAVKGSVIEITQIEVPANMNTWPMFHNGVAAGLRVTPDSRDIDSTWIVYNKPKGVTEVPTEHAGFLMALGLNGHLKTLSYMSIYEYLVKCDEMTSLGLLLGISAAHRGTMDVKTTKLLSVHIEALLPPTALELDIPPCIQIASIMGIGLLYRGTAKRHIAEILLQEIGRPPGPEMENSVERESYALTTGLALGMVTLGQGESAPGLVDLQLAETLHYYMVGGNKRPLTGAQTDKYKISSFQIREGNAVNIDVTAPGAILALGLMFFDTQNEAVANWMRPPETRYLLDFVRPDLLLLRMIARGIIMWRSIEPTTDWVNGQFPESLAFDVQRGPKDDGGVSVDHEAICQAYCNVVTGAALCIGLRFAGTENESAYQTLEAIIQLLLSANGQYLGKFAGTATIETCLVTVLLALSLVYAGTGNLNIIRIIRMLRARTKSVPGAVSYGSHMAVHMALGFLFLGAGRYTLSRTPEAIAALVCALFPKFPTHSNDNRYHLQAFRHLYVLAVEPRLLIPRDIDSGRLCVCRVSYVGMGSTQVIPLRNAPCMLPELSTIKAIYIDDPYFWRIGFERGRNWEQLRRLLEKCDCVDLKQKAGSFSTIEDPKKTKQYLTQTIKMNRHNYWKVDLKNVLSFANDSIVMNLINNFFIDLNVAGIDGRSATANETEIQQKLMIQLNNCLINDKMHEFSVGAGLIMIWNNLQRSPNSFDIWQFKIISKFLHHLQQRQSELLKVNEPLNSGEHALKVCAAGTTTLWIEILSSIIINLEILIEKWTTENCRLIKQFCTKSDSILYLKNENLLNLMKLSAIVCFYSFPINFLDNIESTTNEITSSSAAPSMSSINYLNLVLRLRKFNLENLSLRCLAKILNATNQF